MVSIDTGEFRGSERFEIRRRLGAGGMGVVFEAYDRERRATVALKTLRSVDAHGIYRFKSEFRALADLEHANLVRLGELFCEGGQWFFTMEIVHGIDFLSWVCPHDADADAGAGADADADADADATATAGAGAGGAAPARHRYHETRLRSAICQLALGLDALHAAGKVHRDIKPSNVLVTPQGRAVLLDFGLVADTARHQSTDVVVGTATYMAPEQAASHPVGPEADWYSVGAVLYEALAGRPPFEGRPLEILIAKQRGEPPPPHSGAADLDALCVDLLRRDPAARPRGREVLERLGVAGPRVVPAASAPSLTTGARFVGRQLELSAISAALEATRRGHPITVCLWGESGFGKSALVRRFTDELEGRALVLAGRCYERESVPYKAFDGVIDALTRHLRVIDPSGAALAMPRDVAALARVFPVLRRIPLVAQAAERRIANPQELRARAFAALREMLARLAEQQQLVLFIDDFQWADSDSLNLLQEVMHPPDAPPVMLLLTVRTASGPGSAVLGSVASLPSEVRYLHVDRLPPDDARALAALQLVQSGLPTDEAATIAVEAGGHPLFIRELCWHLGEVGTRFPMAVKLDEALWARVSRLDEPVRRVLEVIALAGAPIAQLALPTASRLPPEPCASALALLRTAHLVRSRGQRDHDALEPYHDRVREAVTAHLDEDTQRAHHAALAEALEGSGIAAQDPQVLVRHLEHAGFAARAAEQARRAAALASEGLAFDRAAELYRTALRLGVYDVETGREVTIALATALVHAGRGPEAADVYLSAVPGAQAATRLDCQRRAAEQLLMAGHIERGVEVMKAVLAEVGESWPSTPRRALASLLWQRTKLRLRGLGWKRRDPTEVPARDLTRLDVYRAVALGLGMIDNIRGADFQARNLLLALQVGEETRIGRALCQEAMFLSSQGERSLPRARQLVARAAEIAQRTGEPYMLAWKEAAAGLCHYFACDFPATMQAVEGSENGFRDFTVGTSWELQSTRIFRIFTLRMMGEYREILRCFPEYVREAARRGDRYAETTLVRAAVIALLAADNAAEAEVELGRKGWAPPESTGYHLQHWYELRAHAELDLYLGRAHETRARFLDNLARMRRSVLRRIQLVRAEADWVVARLHLVEALRGVPGALDQADRLARDVSAESSGLNHVWGGLLTAAVDAQRGRRAAAVERLDAVARRADSLSMRMSALAARLRAGALSGDAAVPAPALATLQELGVKDVGRMLEVVAPGFPRE